ncbi:MAG TPA: hypothetical protein VIL26_06480 [Clostridia bacterium]
MTRNQYKKIKIRLKKLTSRLDELIKKTKADTKSMQRLIKDIID